MSHTIHTGDSAETLKQYPDNHFDSIVTDPPYGIEFLGKDWDSNTGAIAVWQECLRVLKPGGFLLAFSAARTYHHLATNIESVGFEIRDQLMWIYASGFPKAQDIGKAIDRRKGKANNLKRYDSDKKDNNGVDMGSGVYCPKCKKDSTARYFCKDTDCGMIYKAQTPEAQQWSGWKTALKPGHEPIVMARKPMKGSTIDNVLTHGVGALNIDAARIPYEGKADIAEYLNNKRGPMERGTGVAGERIGMFDNQVGFKTIKRAVSTEQDLPQQGRFPSNVLGEIPDYQKYFYCPKVSRRERHCGFEDPGALFPGSRFDIYMPSNKTNPATSIKAVEERLGKKPDPLAHIEKLSNYSQGDVKNHPLWDPSIGTNLQRLKHKILEHNKDLGKKDPLAHIPTGNNIGDGVYAPGTPGPSRKDPLAHIPTDPSGMLKKTDKGWDSTYQDRSTQHKSVGNNHPTVKPVALMRYLIQLVTPPNSTVLDPFCGSGSTGMAARELGHRFVGSDLDPHYVAIANRRIEGWLRTAGDPPEPDLPRVCGPGGSDWVTTQSHQGNNRPTGNHNDRDTANTAADKTQPFDRLFETQ